MQVTLKKAAELSRAALAAAKAIEPKRTTTVSAFSTDDINTFITLGRVTYNDAMNRMTGLIDSGYTLRDLIGTANTNAGVDTMLTNVAALDEKIARFTALSTGSDGHGVIGIGDLSAASRRLEQQRKDALDAENRRYGNQADIQIEIFSPDDVKALLDTISQLKRHRTAIKDQLTAVNFTTKVDIDDDIVAVLRAEKLID